jgi:polar amino acid transport system substrate-binding protein
MAMPLFQRQLRILILVTLLVAATAMPFDAKSREVRLATLVWEPYYGPDLPDDGFCGAIVKAAFSRMGHTVDITYLPWARALMEAGQGRYDGILGGYYTKERAQKFLYSEPFAQARGALVARPEVGISSYETLRDLTPYKISIVNEFAHNEAFDNANFLYKIQVNRVRQSMRMLFDGHVDMAALSVAVFRHESKDLAPDKAKRMKILKPLLFENDLFVMLSKQGGAPEALVADFNKGLAAIKADGTYRAIRERFGQTD